jgi:menaquinone-dependent protoporphyrinogen oxidase
MNILVTSASKHGSTRDIATAIADELRRAGHAAQTRDLSEVASLDGYDAVVLGSAIYMGQLMPEATRFIDAQLPALRARPLWLFASGPLGDDAGRPPIDPRVIEELTAKTGARAATIFAGRLAPETLGLGERLVTAVVRAPSGDYRDWTAIKTWANEIASALVTPEGAGATPPDTNGQGRVGAARIAPSANTPAFPAAPSAGPD